MSEEAFAIARGRLDEWADMFARRDFSALSELYTDQPLFWGSTPTLARDHLAIRDYFQALPPMQTPRVAFSELVVGELAANVLHAAMIATFTSGQAKGQVRLTQTYVRADGVWKIAAHHASPAQ